MSTFMVVFKKSENLRRCYIVWVRFGSIKWAEKAPIHSNHFIVSLRKTISCLYSVTQSLQKMEIQA